MFFQLDFNIFETRSAVLKEVNDFKFAKITISSVLELNVNVVVQKEMKQRVGRDVKEWPRKFFGI